MRADMNPTRWRSRPSHPHTAPTASRALFAEPNRGGTRPAAFACTAIGKARRLPRYRLEAVSRNALPLTRPRAAAPRVDASGDPSGVANTLIVF